MHQASFCDPIGKKMWILRPRHDSPLKVKLGFSEEILAERERHDFKMKDPCKFVFLFSRKQGTYFIFLCISHGTHCSGFHSKKKNGETNPDSDKEQDRLSSVEGGGGLTLARNRGMYNMSSCIPFRTESDKSVTQIPFQTSPIFLLFNSVYFQFSL